MHAIGLFVILCFVAHTRADADLWGHLLFGRDILRSGGVHQADPYSFTSDIPWVNHEWLAEALMWAAYGSGGTIGLVSLKVALVALAGALMLKAWSPFALPVIWRDTLLFAAALGAWPQIATFRPQVFSIAMFALLLFVLLRIREHAGSRLVWLLPVQFAIWVNLHGGWLAGAGVLAVFVVTSFFDPASRVNRVALLTAAIAAAVATLVNPYGPAMLDFLRETVRPVRADIVEWQPMSELPWAALGFWMVPAAIATAALVRNRRRIPLPWLAITLVLAIGAFKVARLVGFFSVAVGFLAAPWAVTRPGAATGGAPIPSRSPVSIPVYGAMLLVAVLLFGRRIPANAPWLPEPEAVRYVQQHRLTGKMLTWFDYGQYAIWHLWPAVRVSMDGRRETVYSESIRDVHREIYGDSPGALAQVDRLAPDSIWLPLASPAIAALERSGWRIVFRGVRSAILSRDSSLPVEISTSPVPNRWFPGP